MNRKLALRAALVGLPLVAALLYAALNWYTLEDETIRVRAGELAREDPYLAYGRLLDRMGARTQRAQVPSVLDELPPKSTLVFAARRLAYMTPGRVSRIRDWVDRGGSLVLEYEREAIDDPLLEAFGVKRVYPERDDAKNAQKAAPRDFTGANAVTQIDWPELGKPLRARLGTRWGELRDQRVRSDVREVRQGSRLIALSFDSGAGRVTALPTLAFLRNDNIGDYDHAELGWRLAAMRSPVVLYLRMQSPPLLEWVRRDAWPVILAAALLLLLWLARIIPRFGPLQPEAAPARRSLIEHVVASGRFLWSRGAGPHLVEAVRERALRAARRRGISPNALPKEATASVHARIDPASFTERVAALQKLEERLAQRGKT
jgi:hypothetical protein